MGYKESVMEQVDMRLTKRWKIHALPCWLWAKDFYHPKALLMKYREKPISQVASFSNWQVPGVNRYVFSLSYKRELANSCGCFFSNPSAGPCYRVINRTVDAEKDTQAHTGRCGLPTYLLWHPVASCVNLFYLHLLNFCFASEVEENIHTYT